MAYVLFILLTMQSCKIVQVTTVTPFEKSKMLAGSVFSNDTLTVSYDFWVQNGIMRFSIENNSEQPVFINWKNSAFIRNGNKMNYWNDDQITQTSSAAVHWGYGIYSGASKSKTSRKEQITSIPPHSKIERFTFYLQPDNTVPISNTDI